MSDERPRRRIRVRRRRKGDGLVSSAVDVLDGAEVVGQFGCCLVEAVTGAAALALLFAVPAYWLLV